jgi:hypothetical protein
MVNGLAVKLPVELEPPSNSAPKPDEAPIELAIGQAMAAAACTIAAALEEYRNGGLQPATRTASGEKIAKLFALQQATLGEIDFPAVARAEAKHILRGYLPDEFYQRYGKGAGEVAVNLYVDAALEILGKVTLLERTWAS